MTASKKAAPPVWVQKALATVTSWRLWRTWTHYADKRGAILADAITYRSLFGVFAAVLLAFSLAGIWFTSNPTAKTWLITLIDSLIPGLIGPGGLVDPDSITAITSFSITGAISLIALLMAALSAISSCRTSVEILCDISSQQLPWFVGIIRDFVFSIILVVLFILAAGVMHFGSFAANNVFDWIGEPGASPFARWTLSASSYLVVLLVNMVLISVFYRVFSGQNVRSKGQFFGAFLGAVALLVLQLFSNFFVSGASANPLLASFASLIALLLWLNLSAQVILLSVTYIFVGPSVAKTTDAAHTGSELNESPDAPEQALNSADNVPQSSEAPASGS